jgi:N-terminal domain of NWD NACHT-NTPase
VTMSSSFGRAKAKTRELWNSATGKSDLARSSSSLPVLAPEPTRPQTTQSRQTIELEPLSLPSLQEQIWTQAYDDLREKEPKLVEAFHRVISAELHHRKRSAEPADRTGSEVTGTREVGPHEMRQLVQDGLDRTKREASIRQGIDDGMHAVDAVRGIMDRAFRAAPETAVLWATVTLGLEVCHDFLSTGWAIG